MKLSFHQFDLQLEHPFRISRETTTVQPTLVVELSAEGERGFGEATTNSYYGVTRESMIEALRSVESVLATSSPLNPEGLWDQLAETLHDHPFAHCALDQAAHDLAGKLAGLPTWRRWELTDTERPVSNFTIGIDDIERMVAKMAERPNWPIYKIKLGTDHDLEIVRALREHTAAVFRVDANCGWNARQTVENSHELARLGVEFIEQPLPAGQWDDQQLVFQQSALPIIADESCIAPADVAACQGYFHGVNIKLTKCGGLTPARRMIAAARKLGLKTMVGCMTESTVGISAIAQLLPLLDYVDMDGAELLAGDIASGVRVIDGVCHYAERNGNGVCLLTES